MKHLTEETLVLHYYGDADEDAAVEQHCAECEACRALYHSIERALGGLEKWSVPERGAAYGAEVWKRLQPALPARSRVPIPAVSWRWAVASLALAAMLVLAFLAGRSYPPGSGPAPTVAKNTLRERVLLVALSDYLERSQRMLTELANAGAAGPYDISFEQGRAADLLDESRLYRQTAARTGDDVVAGVLDELERVLLEIAHGPSRISPAELEDLRFRLQAEGILFKLRVLSANVRNQDQPAIQHPL
ncbi:MAG: hypothetical protein LAP40_25490 [Acidobacteriia bacterium]|nr:hypothetical protein [Terriglobia bacterium]